mmetsp:Transcript_12605/g.31442  ORF Transcript_12605/g.31442 Transcript_12605/m.31442 type:complete len:102 (+) Transcript_12605:250-555(+)
MNRSPSLSTGPSSSSAMLHNQALGLHQQPEFDGQSMNSRLISNCECLARARLTSAARSLAIARSSSRALVLPHLINHRLGHERNDLADSTLHSPPSGKRIR